MVWGCIRALGKGHSFFSDTSTKCGKVDGFQSNKCCKFTLRCPRVVILLSFYSLAPRCHASFSLQVGISSNHACWEEDRDLGAALCACTVKVAYQKRLGGRKDHKRRSSNHLRHTLEAWLRNRKIWLLGHLKMPPIIYLFWGNREWWYINKLNVIETDTTLNVFFHSAVE